MGVISSVTGPRVLLRVEGLAVLAGAIALYVHLGHGWVLIAVLALAPDLAAVGYLAGGRAGAAAYNAAHTYAGPVALAVAGVVAGADTAVQLALIWFVHIGADRLLGYGLKYPSAFKDTHLQRV